MMKTLSAALVGVALIAAPAIAQNANPDAKMQPQASKASQNEPECLRHRPVAGLQADRASGLQQQQ